MTFLGAMFLLAIPVIGIPVAIHMMKKRQRDVVPWGAMQFLRDPTRHGQRMSQMDRWLLLAARVLLLSCLVGALAQPLLQWGHTSATDGLPTQIVLIDDTRSTLADDCFESIKQVAIKLIASFPSSTPVEVWAAGHPARKIASNLTASNLTASNGKDKTKTLANGLNHANSTGDLKSAIANFSPRAGGGDFSTAVRQALATSSNQRVNDLDLWLITDDTEAGWQMPLSSKSMALKENQRLHLLQIETTRQVKHQLAVVSVDCSRRVIASGESVSISATVANYGSGDSPGLVCVWRKDGVVIAEDHLRSIEPNGQQTVKTELSIEQAGTHAITCDLNLPTQSASDALAADDIGHTVVQVVEEVPMLVIHDSENQFGSAPTDADYLAAALGRNLGSWKSGFDQEDRKPQADERNKTTWNSLFKPEVVDAGDLGDVRWQRYPVMVWLGGTTLPPTALRDIVSHVRRGAGLWITLDGQTDRNWINESLGQKGLGISIAGDLAMDNSSVGDLHSRNLVGGLVINKSIEQMQRLHPPDPTDPILAPLSDTQRLDLDTVRIRRRIELEAPSIESASRVILRTFEGDPIAVLSSVGRGRTIVQSLPMNPSWSNFALSKSFVVWVLQVLDHLSQPVSQNFNLTAGQMFRHHVETIDHEFLLTLPDGTEETLVALPSVAKRGEDLAGVVRFKETQQAGLYHLKDLDDQQVADVVFAVSGVADESRVLPTSPERWQDLALQRNVSFHRHATSFDFASMLSAIPKIDTTANQGLRLWPALLLGLIMAVVLETFLAGYAALRRYGQIGTSDQNQIRPGSTSQSSLGGSSTLARENLV